jgi:superfamily II DNA/RNA helicase/HKD family nuclease
MNNFITNSPTKQLKNRILELLSRCRELKILVGFFYFSGLKELYEGLKNNPDVVLKVLVGLNVDRANYGLIEYAERLSDTSDNEKINRFFQSIRNSINTEHFDNREFYEQVRFFIELIKTDRLIIRKTYEPNHAKLYIFKLEETQVGRNTLFITGSSNLTSLGLTRQHEFNVEISDYGFEDAEAYFDKLWERAVLITEDNVIKKELIKLLEHETLIKEITPFEAYVLVLKNYLSSFKGKALGQRLVDLLNERGYKIYNYQLDAISQALSIINEQNGVIIADVVGLGKTVIACAVAYELKKRGIVIAPPGLIGDKAKKSGWRKYLEDFYLSNLGWEAYSIGDLEKVEELVQSARDIEVVIIEPVTIRRNRLDLQENPNYKDEVKELSRVKDPEEWFYQLTEEQSRFYDTVISKYFALPDEGGRFSGAIYRPFIYEKYEKGILPDSEDADLTEEENFQYQQQFNLYDFMRRLLVKRFESSFGAFKKSVENFKDITKTVLQFINKTQKYILDRSLLLKIYNKDIDEIEEELKDYAERIKNNEYPKNHKIYEIEKFKGKERFLNDIKGDLELFDNILKELQRLDLVNNDPKAECLIENVRKVRNAEPDRKVVIFAEYIDTVKYLEPILQNHFNNRVLVVAGDLSSGKIREIYENFDASYPSQKNDYDILLTTDKISEGFNLNRAGMVINYDIPWNPVRVIQRVGRINRISKKFFDELYIVNFFPTEKGADLVKSRDIASNKMFLIHNALGEDAKIFDIDEEPSPSGLYKRIQQNPDYIESESFYTKILKEFERVKSESPELIKSLKEYPPRIKVAKRADKDELIVVIKKGRLFVHYKRYSYNIPPVITNIENIYERVKADKNDPAVPLSDRFWDEYERLKNFTDTTKTRLTEQSLQQKAINMLKSLINNSELSSLTPYKDFLRMLLEDILDYGTLPDYTLRRIANLDPKNIASILKEIERLRKTLGDDYLYREKDRLTELTKEIIIAIENRAK